MDMWHSCFGVLYIYDMILYIYFNSYSTSHSNMGRPTAFRSWLEPSRKMDWTIHSLLLVTLIEANTYWLSLGKRLRMHIYPFPSSYTPSSYCTPLRLAA